MTVFGGREGTAEEVWVSLKQVHQTKPGGTDLWKENERAE